MDIIAAAAPAQPYGGWAYVAVFALMALSFAGIPALGAAVVGWASVLASQGKLNIFAVLIVAALGAEAGGLAGYGIGSRWGRRLLDRPGRWGERLRRALAAGEALYEKWGRLAVFFTSTIVSGILENEVFPVRGVEFRRRRGVCAVGRASRLRDRQGRGR